MNTRKRKLNTNIESGNQNQSDMIDLTHEKVITKKPSKNEDKCFNLIDYLNENEWLDLLKEEFEKDYFKQINKFLNTQYKNKNIKPDLELIFNSLNSTKLSQIKIVILGQDPYHNDDQADGLAFSIPSNQPKLPRSLQNIFTELKNDIPDFERDKNLSGCLQKWTKEGVFLLNTTLTVEAHKPNSHSKIGWSIFTDRVIELISQKNESCVFLLWGNYAHKKESLIDSSKHLIIKSGHPSPLSQKRDFLGCKCFSKANDYLKSKGKDVVNWSLK